MTAPDVRPIHRYTSRSEKIKCNFTAKGCDGIDTTELTMSQIIGSYEVLSELGRGGMGVVYKAFEPKLKRVVALKMLNEGIAHQPGLVERFYREAHAMATLSDPHVVQIYAVGEHQGQPFFVMEYIDGESLGGRLKRERMSVRDARKVMMQAASGLQSAHEQGLIHRDIKPGNLMLTQKGSVKVTDFGIALAEGTGERLTGTGGIIGTPGYLSPEACLGEPLDARTDIFALGVVFYEMLTGRLPFDDKSPYALMAAVVQAQIPDVTLLNSEVDPNTLSILTKMLARRPAERYQTCAEVVSALEAGMNASPVPPPRPAAGNMVLPPVRMPTPVPGANFPTPPFSPPPQNTGPGYPTAAHTGPIQAAPNYPPSSFGVPGYAPQANTAPGYLAQPQMPRQGFAPTQPIIMPPQKSSLMPWVFGGVGALVVLGWLVFTPSTPADPDVPPNTELIPAAEPPLEPTQAATDVPLVEPASSDAYVESAPVSPESMQTLLGTYKGTIGKAEFVLVLQQESNGEITGYNLANGKRRPVNGKVESFSEDIDADGDTWSVFNVVLEEPGEEDNDGKFRLEIKHTQKYVSGSGSWTSFSGSNQFNIAVSGYSSTRE